MRRATGVFAVSLFAALACRGSAAQEPGDGPDAGRAPAPAAPAAASAERIASEVDVRRAIAFVADERPRALKRARSITVVERKATPATRVVREPEVESNGDVEVVMNDPISHEVDAKPATDEKPAAPKVCNGVVNRRS